jgi:hypothetical protein
MKITKKGRINSSLLSIYTNGWGYLKHLVTISSFLSKEKHPTNDFSTKVNATLI